MSVPGTCCCFKFRVHWRFACMRAWVRSLQPLNLGTTVSGRVGSGNCIWAPLEEQLALLTPEPSLWPPGSFLVWKSENNFLGESVLFFK